jgi:archaellum biogenesis protein FlaJ (TadC family)
MENLAFDHRDILTYSVILIAIIQGIVLYLNANRKQDNELKKIWDDTLKNPNGKYSRKSVYMFICFYIGVFIGICMVINDTDKHGEYVFTTFFLTGTGLNVLAHLDKSKKQQIEDATTNNE